jgi:hypothetical protein
MIVDHEGRILAQADPGPGEKIVVATIDIDALRHERATRTGHHMLAHLRIEAYSAYRGSVYPPGQWTQDPNLDPDKNRRAIEAARRRAGWEGS